MHIICLFTVRVPESLECIECPSEICNGDEAGVSVTCPKGTVVCIYSETRKHCGPLDHLPDTLKFKECVQMVS